MISPACRNDDCAAILAICVTIWGLGGCGRRVCDDVYTRKQRPDGRYEVVVCVDKRGGISMPGQSGDSPGFVRLIDLRTRKILHEKNIGMVQEFPGVEWREKSAYMMLFADWPLPPE